MPEEPTMSEHSVRLPLWSICLALTLGLGVVEGSLLGEHEVLAATVTGTQPAAGISAAQTAETKPALQTTFAPVVQKVMPSVVNIFSSRKIKADSRNLDPFLDDPLFRRFFGDQFGGQPPIPKERQERSLGSGVIVSSDGYILTNNHVVDGGTDIKVSLNDKREFTARVVGTDSKTDLAVLKIDQTALPTLALADSSKVQVGDIVLAIGNPFGVGQTVTMGIVCATGRGGLGIEDYEDFIQTDAAINPGNSGGALVNAEGRLVGISTAILSRSGGNQGIGFAVPINLARYVMERIVAEGKITRGYLGVRIQPLTPDLAKEFKLPADTGALVGEVTPKTPAAEAGLKEGDVIIEFNGKKVADDRHLRLMAAQTPPGTRVTLKALRDGKEQTFTVKPGELPSEGLAKAGRSGGRSPSAKGDPLDGVEVTDLDTSARRQLNIPNQVRG